MTLIELIIVVAVMGILLTTAIPSYRDYSIRVHRTDAIRMLLQASMCQQRLNANQGKYDTSQCRPASEHQRYTITYDAGDQQGRTYTAMAVPVGPQLADPCGSLMLDQNGSREISAENVSAVECWSGR